jgi:hypothetical protein
MVDSICREGIISGMDEPTSLTDLVRRHRQGNPEAARALFAYYAQRLSRLAERRVLRRPPAGSCGAAGGTTTAGAAGRRTASGSTRGTAGTRTCTAVSAWL